MVSVGASGIVGQAVSGLILMYTRTLRPGDYVRVGEAEGTVTVMGMFTTRVGTGMGEELTLPNATVLGSVTRNFSRAAQGAGFTLDASVTIGYDVPWRQVRRCWSRRHGGRRGRARDSRSRASSHTALSDFYIEYRLVCQPTPSEPRPRAERESALHARSSMPFNEHGVQIMSPHYLGDPAREKVVPKAKWYAPPAEPPR